MADLFLLLESNTTGTGRLFAERARELGLTPLLLCADPSRYPYVSELGLAHRVLDTSSAAAIDRTCAELATEHRIAGVASSSDYFVAAAAALARRLGLPGEHPERVAEARDKGRQRRVLAAAGVASPEFRLVTSPAEGAAAAVALGLDVVVKPVDRSGSAGVRRCRTPEQAAEHVAGLLAVTHDERGRPTARRILVERYLDGPEFSVEILHGRVRAVVAKHVDESLGFLETGHDVPAARQAAELDELSRTASAAAAALRLGFGAAHVELRLVKGSAVVVEVNPRLAGGMIPIAVEAATGQDLIVELVARSAGLPIPATAPRHGAAAVRFVLPDRDGTLLDVPGADALRDVRELPGVVAAQVTAVPGREVSRDGSFLDRLGCVVATGCDLAQAGARASVGVGRLTPRIGAPAFPAQP